MNPVTLIPISIVSILASMAAGHVQSKLLCTNSTLNLTHPLDVTPCASLTASATADGPTIYTAPPNSSVALPTMYLYSFAASVSMFDFRAQ